MSVSDRLGWALLALAQVYVLGHVLAAGFVTAAIAVGAGASAAGYMALRPSRSGRSGGSGR